MLPARLLSSPWLCHLGPAAASLMLLHGAVARGPKEGPGIQQVTNN